MDELDYGYNKFRVVEDYHNPSYNEVQSVGDRSTAKLSVKVSESGLSPPEILVNS